jgi:hypothetical protein
VEQHDLLRWLKSQLTDERIVLYGSAYDGSSVFVHSVLVPTSALVGSWERLPSWDGKPFDLPSCGLVYGGGEGHRIEFNDPWKRSQPNALRDAQRLVFGRTFEGRIGTRAERVELDIEIAGVFRQRLLPALFDQCPTSFLTFRRRERSSWPVSSVRRAT